MAWLPISGTLPQYSTADNGLAANYYIKFYASGTATPINMATDSTGGTLLAKCALSADGYPITNPLDDSTRFIPHIDQDYRIVMYANETDADNNATANATFNIDGMVLQVVPTGDASNITLRDSTIEEQDDYDRSPLFVDGTDFTAGAGPHVITVPSGWAPTNPGMRFYRLDNSGIVTPITPSSTSSTTFTLAETLLSTDVIFIGDDEFRSLSYGVKEILEEDAANNFNLIKQPATTSSSGVIEKSTQSEMNSGTPDKFPDAATIKAFAEQNQVFAGRVNSNGSAFSLPTGWSSTRTGAGKYTITHNLGTTNYAPVANALISIGEPDEGCHLNAINTNNFTLSTGNFTNDFSDRAFTFHVALF